MACISEGGNPKPILSWEVLISPGIDRHSQKVSADVLELQEINNEKVFIFQDCMREKLIQNEAIHDAEWLSLVLLIGKIG